MTLIPSKSVRKKVVKPKEAWVRRQDALLFSRAAVSSRPNSSRRSRHNFASSVLLLSHSVISREKRTASSLHKHRYNAHANLAFESVQFKRQK